MSNLWCVLRKGRHNYLEPYDNYVFFMKTWKGLLQQIKYEKFDGSQSE